MLLLLLPFLIAKASSQDCSLNVAALTAPFILDDNYNFPSYDSSHSINFKHEETFYISCPKGTSSSYISQDGDHAACENGTIILNIGTIEVIDFASIKCNPVPVTTVRKSEEKCVNNNTLIEIGFEMNRNFVSMITVCFDDVKLVPLYCKYRSTNAAERKSIIFSESDFYRSYVCNGTECGFFDSGTIYSNINLDGLYDKQEQILHNLGVTDVDKSLIRLPLTADLLGYTKLQNVQQIKVAPFFDYVNVVPVWDAEESLNYWINLHMTEIMSENRKSVLYTGSLGILTLLNGDDEEVEVYLSNGRVPVPKWIWMVWEYGEDHHRSIAFLYNHPYQHVDAKSGEVCSTYEVLYSDFIISCAFEDVVDPEIRKFIESEFE